MGFKDQMVDSNKQNKYKSKDYKNEICKIH